VSSTSDPLEQAALGYVEFALGALRERCPSDEDVPLELGLPAWEVVDQREDGARVFQLSRSTWSAERVCAIRELGTLRESDEFRRLKDALAADEIVGSRLGGMVGSAATGSGPWQIESLVESPVDAILEQADAFEMSEETIRGQVSRWVTALRAQEIEITAVAPLADLTAAEPPLRLSPDAEIDELTVDELALGLQMGVVGFMFGPRFGPNQLEYVPKVFGARVRYHLPIVVGEIGGDDLASANAKREKAFGLMQEALTALRLFKRGRVSASGSLVFTRDPLFLGGAQGGRNIAFTRGSRPPLEIDAAEGAEFERFWPNFVSARSNKLIGAASRRFGFAAERGRADDEIVDLVIAAETLFLGDIGKPSDRGEMTYRLAVRSASFLESSPSERLKLLKFMKIAYAARSGIVHGGELDESKLRNREGAPATADVFADELEDVVRAALRKSMDTVASGKSFPPDWDQVLFSGA